MASLNPGTALKGLVTFRIVAGDPDHGDILLDRPIYLSPGNREVVVPFKVQPGGRPLWFVTQISAASEGTLFGGWREMRITNTSPTDLTPALPFGSGLKPVHPDQMGEAAGGLWFARDPVTWQPESWVMVPAENWRRDGGTWGVVRVDVEFEANPSNLADPVVVTLAWSRAGRFEIMAEKMIDLRSSRTLALEAPVTEPGGWVGLLTRPAGGEGAGHRMRVLSWQKK